MAAENLIIRQQLIIMNQTRQRVPALTIFDRFLFGLSTMFISSHRLNKICVILKPKTLLLFHQHLVQRKYHRLFSAKKHQKPGPKGPTMEIIQAVVAMKKKQPSHGLS
ncbi:MAG: hypothetical protein OQL19_16380 [Gammaproteobacteria bacterium]|nr:hypothetical protein [Gammaproteobacteria bacterium]